MTVVVFNITRPAGIADRVRKSLWFIMIVIPCYIAWFVGGAESLKILLVVGINASLGMAVVLYPWDSKSLDTFLQVCAFFGIVLAYNSLRYFGTYESLENASEMVLEKYLPVAMASGIACIASLYLVAKKMSLFHVGLFVVNWLGLALSRGRGAVLICAATCVVYILVLIFSKKSTLSGFRKTVIIAGAATLTPFIINKLIMTRGGKWDRLLFDFARELDEGQRGFVMTASFNRIMEAPVLGNGLGQYIARDYHPHNLFLQFGVDSGFLGMLIVFIFLSMVLRFGYICIKHSVESDVNLSLALTGIFVYTIGNFMKSGDAYIGRDWFIISALPLCIYCVLVAKEKIQRQAHLL